MSGSQKALEYFDRGYNCAQSALIGCGHLTELDDLSALKVAGGFGGGMRVGSICGAATGALMALGCIFPFTDDGQPDQKSRIGQLTLDFLGRFSQAHGCLNCTDLVKGDKEGAHQHLCPKLVAWSVETVEAMAAENR